MSRDDLLITNMKIVGSVTKEVVKRSPNAILVVVSNPLDAMVQHVYSISGFPKQRVVGMAGILDTARFRTFLSQELNVSVTNISAYVLGGHGDTMVPLIGSTTVGGVPISTLIKPNRLNEIIQRTRDGGAEIVGLLKTGSAYYAPGASITLMLESIVKNQNSILPVCAYLNNEYGFKDIYSGVPAIIGKDGVKKVIELKLNNNEKKLFNNSVNEIIKTVDELKKLKLLV